MSSEQRNVQLVTSLEDLNRLSHVWRGLWDRCEHCRTPFLDFDWVRLWVEHYRLDGLLRALVVTQDSGVTGIVPLVLHRYGVGPLGVNVVETLAGQSRNLVGLVQPGAEEAVAESVAGFISQNMLARGTSMRLSLVPEGSRFADALVGAFAECGYGKRTSTRVVSRAPYVPLPVAWEDYWRAMSHRRKKVLRRAAKALDNKHSVSFVECGLDEVPWGTRTLYELHQKRWQGAGIRGLFADCRARAFHTAVALAHVDSRLIRVSIMMVDGKPVSAHIVGVLDGVAYLMRSGRDESLARYSIGHLHDINLFQRAIREGLWEADFLRGAEPYKFYWTSRYRLYNDILVVGRVAHGLSPVWFVRLWLSVAEFLEHRHTIGEFIGMLRVRRREALERKRMRLDI